MHHCVKYSGAKTAELRIAIEPCADGERRDLLVGFRDHGHGFAAGGRRGSGYGLANLAARAEALGGRAEVASELGRGTTVMPCVPGQIERRRP